MLVDHVHIPSDYGLEDWMFGPDHKPMFYNPDDNLLVRFYDSDESDRLEDDLRVRDYFKSKIETHPHFVYVSPKGNVGIGVKFDDVVKYGFEMTVDEAMSIITQLLVLLFTDCLVKHMSRGSSDVVISSNKIAPIENQIETDYTPSRHFVYNLIDNSPKFNREVKSRLGKVKDMFEVPSKLDFYRSVKYLLDREARGFVKHA